MQKPFLSKKIILGLVGIAGVIWFSTDSFFDVANQYKKQSISINKALIPAGWYVHSINSYTILTRFLEISDIEATEMYAYGDYILINTGIFDGKFKNLEEWNEVRWVFEDDALVRNWSKTKIEGYDSLRVEHKAAGASGEHLTYFLFSGNEFISISLYSQDILVYINGFEQFVREYVGTLKE